MKPCEPPSINNIYLFLVLMYPSLSTSFFFILMSSPTHVRQLQYKKTIINRNNQNNIKKVFFLILNDFSLVT